MSTASAFYYRLERVLAMLLAVSGALYAILAIATPVLWFGYVIWISWICIACGFVKKRGTRLSWWGISFVWHLLLTPLAWHQFNTSEDWYLLVLPAHVWAAIIISGFALVVEWRMKQSGPVPDSAGSPT